MDMDQYRTADYAIDPLFIHRWSPRAFKDEAVPEADLMSFFEAARWAPSSTNAQPWRFLYARKGTDAWQAFFGAAMEGTQKWLINAPVIVYFVSRTTIKRGEAIVPSPSHAFDCGAAWENFALQVTRSGYACHAAGSFDRDKARAVLGLPDDWAVHCVVGVGRQAPASVLPEPLAEREIPSSRLPVSQLAMEGGFKAS